MYHAIIKQVKAGEVRKKRLVKARHTTKIKTKFLLMKQTNSVDENMVNSTGRYNNPKFVCT